MGSGVWIGVAAMVSASCLVWLVLNLARQSLPRILVFVVYAIFFRFLLSAFHPYTFPPIAGPFSINALYSLLVIGLGFMLIDLRLLRLRFLLPVYGLVLLTLISALYNDTLSDSIQSLLKWLFFVVIALAVYESVIRVGRATVLENLFKSFSIPIVLQVLAVALGHSKLTETDNSTSYVGGYNHEAVFSVMLLTAMMLVALRQFNLPRTRSYWSLVPLLLAVGVAMTNYRTNILAMLMPLLGYLVFRFLHKGMPLAKVTAALMMTAGVLFLVTADLSGLVARFGEIGTVIDSLDTLIKSPLYYTEWEQDYFSARVYIWSQYIDAYNQSNGVQHLIGLGADSWEHHFRKYAHNTFVSYLYELGLLGCIGLGYFFLRNMLYCLSGPLTAYGLLLFLGFFGFLVINLGTMPLWQIEGMVMFAILNALAWEFKLGSAVGTLPQTSRAEDAPVLTGAIDVR